MLDILEDETGDLLLENGDLQIGESTKQHQRDILLARQGEYRRAPLRTIGIEDFIDDEKPDDLQAAIRIAMAKDGMKVKANGFDVNGHLILDASYD
jgi:hypothetical protein